MAISVVYTITEIKTARVKDIIVHTDNIWFNTGNETVLVTGGIREKLDAKYPSETYKISVDVLTHPGSMHEE